MNLRQPVRHKRVEPCMTVCYILQHGRTICGVRQTQTADLQTADRRPQTADLQTCRPADLQTYRQVRNSRGKGVIDQYLGKGDRGDQ